RVRIALLTAFTVLLLSVVWLNGVFVGRHGGFPLRYIISAKNFLTGAADSKAGKVQYIRTVLVPLKVSTFDNLGPVKLAGWGGGFGAVGNTIIGVDRRGSFFRYEGKGHFDSLPITLDMNEDAYRRYLTSVRPDSRLRSEIDPRFRVLDLEAAVSDRTVTLYVSYDYWHTDEPGKTVRVARLVLNGGLQHLDDAQTIRGDAWEIIYESHPLLPFSLVVRSPFNINRSGGRMVVDGDGSLLVTIGDHLLDGFRYPNAPSDTTSSYGKVIRINLASLQSEIFTTGNRNPQGLTIDAGGNVWETEHGPRGGDELNLLRQGVDYGWPAVTYGVDYGSYSWPLNANQGRHDGYEKPVFAWAPSIATSNLIQIHDTPSQWDGDLLVSGLRSMRLFRIRVDGEQVRLVEPVLIGERIRDLIQMQDGTILLWTDAAHFVEVTVDAEGMAASSQFPVELTSSEIDLGLDQIIQQCQACHGMGPHTNSQDEISLWGIYDRAIAETGYPGYSSVLKSKGGHWTAEDLESFLASPSEFAPGSFMPDPSIADPAAIRALVGYLKRLK
ncbi:MAG: PQQ-dependent sugar dehydrogenase, partial [Rhodothermales bacterium]